MTKACPATRENETKQLVCLLIDEPILRGFAGSLISNPPGQLDRLHLFIIPKSLQ